MPWEIFNSLNPKKPKPERSKFMKHAAKITIGRTIRRGVKFKKKVKRKPLNTLTTETLGRIPKPEIS